jgi:dTDP-4-dehydrorhamnose reductase
MKKVLILGAGGMLGNIVFKKMRKLEDFFTEGTIRKTSSGFSIEDQLFLRLWFEIKIEDLNNGDKFSFWTDLREYIEEVQPDYIINCIGMIKPHSLKNPALTVYINGVFPYQLADVCKEYGVKLVHITTDCCFSGKTGSYDEFSIHDPEDLYGKTKSVGEPGNCMVIRTSIIGEEIANHSSLVAWVKSQKGKEVKGFTNHFWNGVTTNQLAENLIQIVKEDLYSEDTFHVTASDSVTKYELLCLLNSCYELQLSIEPIEFGSKVDRTLCSQKPLNEILNNPTVGEMVEKMSKETKNG